jgi:hypothetical protein
MVLENIVMICVKVVDVGWRRGEDAKSKVEGGRASEISGCDFGDVRSGDDVQEAPECFACVVLCV